MIPSRLRGLNVGDKMELKEAISELRKQEKRKFNQTIDLLVSLKGIDLRKDNIALIATIPHKFKEKKVCGFLESKNEAVKTITKPEFDRYKEKNELKKLVREYDFFIGNAKLMPAIAAAFGKVLGPAGKMPSPQLGVVSDESAQSIKKVIEKISKSIKIKAREPAIKVAIGKESMKDEEIIENIKSVYESILDVLPSKRDNVRKVMIKMTMGRPARIEI